MDYTEMSKKEFKNYINEKGFFVNFNAERINKNDFEESLEENAKSKIMAKLPKWDNIVVFQGIASQNYGVGKKNRNWYKIDQSGWMFDSYKGNPIMLLQHNHEYGGIGHSLRLFLDEKGNLNNIFYVDMNTLDERTKYQVENWYITAVSTSHITHEDMIEDNKTWERYTWEEARDKDIDLWSVIFGVSESHTMVVTKAEMIENSLVTIGSNEEAIVSHNSVWNYFTNKYTSNMKITKAEKENLLNQPLSNSLKAKINELEVEEAKEEDKEENKEEVKEENKEEVKEEVKEESPSGDKKEDEPENGDSNMDAEAKKEPESPENGDEEPENGDSDKGEAKVEAPASENDKKEENSIKTQENLIEFQKNEIESLKNELQKVQKENADKFKVLEDAVWVALENTISITKSMKNVLVEGVDAFKQDEDTPKKENRLSSLLKEIKKG